MAKGKAQVVPDGLVLDLSETPKRPTVRLPGGDFELRTPDELTFDEFAMQLRVGNALIEAGTSGSDNPDVLTELQDQVIAVVRMMMPTITDDAAAAITPGVFHKISRFFHGLGVASQEPQPSESGSDSAPTASDSTERPAAA